MSVDPRTLAAYAAAATAHARAQHAVAPAPLYALVEAHFVRGADTADVGCGAGRDVAWLNANEFPAVGYDASPEMLRQARTSFPTLEFRQASLPALDEVPNAAFTNVLCNAVLMHLAREVLPEAVASLARIARPGGRVLVSYRAARGRDTREPDGRLFTPIDAEALSAWAAAHGLDERHREDLPDASRGAVVWHTLVFGRRGEPLGADTPGLSIGNA